jgi:hypothetical protein
MKNVMIIITGVLVMASAQSAVAGDDHSMKGHMHGDMKNPCAMKDHQHMKGEMKNPCEMDAAMGQMKKGSFLVKKEIDGFSVSFHIMKAPEGEQHGGTHHFMVKVEKDGKALTNLVANSRSTHPNGKSESKMLMKMGDWYMAAYDLDHEGQHQLMVLFKTSDGAKHFGVVYYPESDKGDN